MSDIRNIFEIVDNRQVAIDSCGRPSYRMELRQKGDGSVICPAMRPGQFVEIAVDGQYLRRPLSVCDSAPGEITLLYKVVGKGTGKMSLMEKGMELDILTGLGHGFNSGACRQSALLVGGGLGAAPLHLLCKELLSLGRRVTVVLGFNSASEVVLADEFLSMGADLRMTTMDGSAGVKGMVTDVLEGIEADRFYTCGPMVMMKSLCAKLDIPGEASLEERMGCGAGYCYCCTCHTADGPARVCKDGPVFPVEKIEWK